MYNEISIEMTSSFVFPSLLILVFYYYMT